MTSLATNASNFAPAVKRTIFRALSSMSRRNSSQLRDTYRLGLDHRPRPVLECPLHHQVHGPPQALLQPPLQPHVLRESRRLAELDQHVHIAVGSRLVSRNRTEQSERRDCELTFQLIAMARE